MRIAILHNRDSDLLEDDPGREARAEVEQVASLLAEELAGPGREVTLLGVDADVFSIGHRLAATQAEVVMNLCESLVADSRGEMVIPALLDLVGTPYTGSPPLALGLALHKEKAKQVLRAAGVPTPDFCVVESVAEVAQVRLPWPLIVKPAREDASVGVDFDSVVWDRASLGRAVGKVVRRLRQPALVERYVEGREVYVPLLGNRPRRALPLTEISFGRAFEQRPKIVSYRAKWDEGSPECVDSPSRPCTLDEPLQRRCVEVAFKAFEVLGCRDYGRVDLRVSPEGEPFVIDINPNCDLHPKSGFAKAANEAGIAYGDLALHLLELALERSHGNQAPRRTGQAAARRPPLAHRDLLSGRGAMRARADRPRARAKQP